MAYNKYFERYGCGCILEGGKSFGNHTRDVTGRSILRIDLKRKESLKCKDLMTKEPSVSSCQI
jgi:hypothetical protein